MRFARTFIAAGLVLAAWGVQASAASAAEPIEGQWQATDGQVLEFFATGPNTYSDRTLDPGTGHSCVDKPRNTKLTGSGLNYTGTVNFYRTSDCTSVGDGKMVVTIAAGGQTMRIGYAQPSDQSCCSSQRDFTRKAAASQPALALSGALAEIINQGLVGIRKQQPVLNGTKKLNRQLPRFASIRSLATSTRRKVKNYKVTSPEEATLKTCGLKWLKYIVNVAAPAKHSKAGVAAGVTNLARCLSPFRQLFPGGKPGTAVPKKAPAKVKQAPPENSRADNFFGVGTDPNLIPRIDFAYDPANSADKIRNINMSVRVACLGKVFYLVLGPEYFPELGFGSAGFGSGTGPVTYASFAGDQPGQFYELEVYLSGSVDSKTTAHGTIKVQRRQGSTTTYCGSSGFKRWYATRR